MSVTLQESLEEPTVIITTSSKLTVSDKHHDTRTTLKDLIELEIKLLKLDKDILRKMSEQTKPIPIPSQVNSSKNAHLSCRKKKIDEIDEVESRATSAAFKSRPPTTRPQGQTSQATFRTSSVKKNIEANSSDDSDDDYPLKKNVLITELGENEFDSYDEDLEDEDRLVITPKKKKNIVFYENDIYNEKDWDTDLEEDKEKQDEEYHSPKNIYKQMCENLKVIPCRYFMAHIDKQKLIMRYHQFSDEEIRAISKPLWNNISVEKLHLDGNWIEHNGAKYLSRMIRQNDFITELSCADNRLGERTEGTQEVCRMIAENCILKKLNLSGNEFSDRDVEILTTALEKNRLLKELDLSHNNFGDEGGKFLGQYIAGNDTLESLDISWNNFRKKAAKEIALGIKENIRLKNCNVSFNGFDSEGGKILADVIKQNNTIESFNISNTRLNAECAASIANALEQNDSLRSLNISNNPITTSGALAIIYAIKLNNASVLEHLDLSEIPITKEFENVLKEIQELRPNFECKRGPVISTSNTKSVLYDVGDKVDFEKIINSLKNKI